MRVSKKAERVGVFGDRVRYLRERVTKNSIRVLFLCMRVSKKAGRVGVFSETSKEINSASLT